MLPPVVAAVWFGPPWSDLLVIAAMAILAWEWARMTAPPFRRPAPLLFAATVVLISVLAAAELWSFAAGLLGLGVLLQRFLTPAAAGRWLAGGVLYLGLPAIAFIWLRHRPGDGLEVIVWLLLVVWAGDIFAYLVGRQLGGPKLWPAVSPKKTWSGLLGGLAAAAAVAAGVAAGVAALGALQEPARPAWLLALAGGRPGAGGGRRRSLRIGGQTPLRGEGRQCHHTGPRRPAGPRRCAAGRFHRARGRAMASRAVKDWA